jgi:hypothetical protein
LIHSLLTASILPQIRTEETIERCWTNSFWLIQISQAMQNSTKALKFPSQIGDKRLGIVARGFAGGIE